MTYPDTSFLSSLYVDETPSQLVHDYMEKKTDSVVFTPFHRLELRTALRLRTFRREISAMELKTALRFNDEDIAEGVLQHTSLIWADALREAERLSELYLTDLGVRSGDLLHVASAVVLGAREFVTFDQRQTVLARRAGLKVKMWRLK